MLQECWSVHTLIEGTSKGTDAKEVANKYSAIYNVYHDIFLTSRMTFHYPTAEREVFDNYQGSVNLQ